MKLQFKRLTPAAKLPKYGSKEAACMDISSSVDCMLFSGETKIILTGFSVAVPTGYELQIRARSGMASRGIMLSNGVGTVDADYRGEVGVILTNTGGDAKRIKAGDRIAQCCVQRVIEFGWDVVEELSETERGDGGYGSTGSN